MTMTQVRYPVAPTPTKRRGSLLDAANEDSAFTWHDGLGLYASYNCLSFGEYADFCESPPSEKDLDVQANWIDGFRFAAYGGFTCRAIGLDQTEMKAGIQRAFEAGESTAVERALMEKRFRASAGSAEVPAVWAAPVDVNSAGAVPVARGIALLEEYAANVYVGAPTLHLPISVASEILGVDGAAFDGDVLRTKFGSKIAAGAGYAYPNTSPTGTNAAAGERWLYATGEVTYARSDVVNVASMDTTNNDVVALVERGYLISVDCFTAAIRVTI